MTDDVDEVDVYLNPHDMDHLEAGQPVFKGVGDETLLVLRPTEWDGEDAETPTDDAAEGEA